MFHASYDFPSHLVPLGEALGLVVLLALLRWAPAGLDWRLAPFWSALERLEERPAWTAAGLAAVALLGNAAICLFDGWPVLRVSDEASYLLAADTFASGRLANPTPPLWPWLETFHVLVAPTYASKYPPAQGLVLAAGQVLGGHPAVGLWLAAAALAVALYWCLRAWLPRPWPLVGALVVVLRLGLGSYWFQSYWGGGMAALGGALLYGGLRRVARHPRTADAVVMAVGFTILGLSRPLEGLAVAAPAGIVFLGYLLTAPTADRRSARWTVLAPAALVLAGATAWGAWYNLRVTGEAWTLPYVLHHRTYILPGWLGGEDSAGRRTGHPVLASAHAGEAARSWRGRETRALVTAAVSRAPRALFFLLGLPLATALVLAPAAAKSDRWMLLPIAGGAVVLLTHGWLPPWFPHYSAPALAPLVVLATAGSRRAATLLRPLGAGPLMATGLVGISALLALAQAPAWRPDPGDWSLLREDFTRHLEALPGRDLVVVRDGVRSAGPPWIANPADPHGAEVLWAQDLGPQETARLAAALPDRRVWVVELPPAALTPRLRPAVAEELDAALRQGPGGQTPVPIGSAAP